MMTSNMKLAALFAALFVGGVSVANDNKDVKNPAVPCAKPNVAVNVTVVENKEGKGVQQPAKVETPAAASAEVTAPKVETPAPKTDKSVTPAVKTPGFFSRTFNTVKAPVVDLKDFVFSGSKKAIVAKFAGVVALGYLTYKGVTTVVNFAFGEDEDRA